VALEEERREVANVDLKDIDAQSSPEKPCFKIIKKAQITQ